MILTAFRPVSSPLSEEDPICFPLWLQARSSSFAAKSHASVIYAALSPASLSANFPPASFHPSLTSPLHPLRPGPLLRLPPSTPRPSATLSFLTTLLKWNLLTAEFPYFKCTVECISRIHRLVQVSPHLSLERLHHPSNNPPPRLPL